MKKVANNEINGWQNPWTAVRRNVRITYASFERLPVQEQACFLTLPLLLLYVDPFWYVRIPVTGLALMGLLFANVRRHYLFWFTLTCFLAAGIYYNWLTVDNHKYLMCYWCLAIFISFWAADEGRGLPISARHLIGFAFSLAVFWKFVSPDFRTGDFFHYSLLFDERFSAKLVLLGWLDPHLLEINQTAQQALTSYDSQLNQVAVIIPSGFRPLANTMTWWTLLVEFLIALTFLLPLSWWPSRLRHGLLLAFVVSTYLVAPVIGFGWLLLTMGFIQCEPQFRRTRILYLTVLLLLQAFRFPWTTIAQAGV